MAFVRDRSIPLSIQTNNPGAMWPNALATRFGSTEWYQINDVQKNKIAVFPDAVWGAAALFALAGTKYVGKTIADAIRLWSGGNSSDEYARRIAAALGGFVTDTLTLDIMKGPGGIFFAKTMSNQEAGRAYPLTDEQWQDAQALAYGQAVPQTAQETKPMNSTSLPVQHAGVTSDPIITFLAHVITLLGATLGTFGIMGGAGWITIIAPAILTLAGIAIGHLNISGANRNTIAIIDSVLTTMLPRAEANDATLLHNVNG